MQNIIIFFTFFTLGTVNAFSAVIIPSNPSDKDSISITISKSWNESISLNNGSDTLVVDTIQITANYSACSGNCSTTQATASYTANIGKLSQGKYYVKEQHLVFSNFISLSTIIDSFTVVEANTKSIEFRKGALLSKNVISYANPVKDNVIITFDNKIETMDLFNSDGTLIQHFDITNRNKLTWGVHTHKPGLYLLYVKTKEAYAMQKLFLIE